MQRTQNSQNNLEEKKKAEGHTLLHVKTYYKAMIIKKMLHEGRRVDQQTTNENPEVTSTVKCFPTKVQRSFNE